MADGSVKEFFDPNGDKFLNPGFQVSGNFRSERVGGIGYTTTRWNWPALSRACFSTSLASWPRLSETAAGFWPDVNDC